MCEKKRSHKALKNSLSEEEYKSFAKEVISFFVSSGDNIDRHTCCEKFNISKDCFYKISDFVILENIVTSQVVQKFMEKITEHEKKYEMYKKENQNSKEAHYNELIKQRYQKLLLGFSNDEAAEIAIYFADNFEKDKQQIAEHFCIDEVLVLDLILKKAILENLIEDSVFEKIKQRSIQKDNTGKAKKLFMYFENERNKATVS